MKALQIELPDEPLAAVGEDKARSLALEALLIMLNDLSQVSSGRGAELLGISRRAFLDLLGTYGASESDDDMSIADEAARG